MSISWKRLLNILLWFDGKSLHRMTAIGFLALFFVTSHAQVRPEVGRPLQQASELLKASLNREALTKVREAESVGMLSVAEQLAINRFKAAAAQRSGELNTAEVALERIYAGVMGPEKSQVAESLAGVYALQGKKELAREWLRLAKRGGIATPAAIALEEHLTAHGVSAPPALSPLAIPEIAWAAPPASPAAQPPVPTITTTRVRPMEQPVPVTPPPAPAVPVRVAPVLNFNGCRIPEYTTAARRAEAQGTVAVIYTMDVDGRIIEASIEKSSGPTAAHKQLDEATLRAVKECSGRPGTVDGKPEPRSGRVEYVWKLSDDSTNSCLSLDGTQYLQATRKLIPTDSDFTIEFRFFLREHTGGFSEVISQGQQLFAFYMGISPDREVRLGDSWGSTGVYMPVREWATYTLVYRLSGRAEFYVNGRLFGQRAKYEWNKGGTDTRVGASYSPDRAHSRINGCIDDLKIWKTARTASQVSSRLPSSATVADDDLIAHYNFSPRIVGGLIQDHTGNEKNSLKPLATPLFRDSSKADPYQNDAPLRPDVMAATTQSFSRNEDRFEIRAHQGEIFRGKLYGGKFHGKNQSGKKEYFGDISNGHAHGQGTMLFEEGAKYVGPWQFGSPSGIGVFSWASGTQYVGGFTNGVRQGEAIIYDSRGVILEEGVFQGDKLIYKQGLDRGKYPFNIKLAEAIHWPTSLPECGPAENRAKCWGFYTNSPKGIMIGEFENGYSQGFGINFLPDGSPNYVGEFANTQGQFHGVGAYVWNDNSRWVGIFKIHDRTEGILYDGGGRFRQSGSWANGKIQSYPINPEIYPFEFSPAVNRFLGQAKQIVPAMLGKMFDRGLASSTSDAKPDSRAPTPDALTSGSVGVQAEQTRTPPSKPDMKPPAVSAEASQQLLLDRLEKMQKQLETLQASASARNQNQVPPLQSQTAVRRALVIGNDKYRHVPQLSNAREDAAGVASVLGKIGYSVIFHQDVDERKFKQVLREFRAALEGGEEVLFYFAGHGVQLGSANYLLPIDVKGDNEDQVRDEAIELQRILDDMKSKSAKFSLAIIDACRDNPFKSSGRSIGGRGLAPTTAATGQMIMFSAGVGQQALDKLGPQDKEKNGVFTRVLLQEMVRPGVPVDRVLRNVRNEVVRLSKSIGHEQTPALYDQAVGDFFFTLK